ncbi:MAG: UDP-N-acetylmuramoyl-tripeptide--D-alanyl-D-alanine ligase [Gammaproteobacteria bacterium]
MIELGIAELAGQLGAELRGAGERRFTGCCTDTRTLRPGQLFVALPGPRYDGHDFVAEAERKGAAAAVVERPLALSVPQVVVPDARAALGHIAGRWRERFQVPVIAVTGSNGKTTVKEMLLAILTRCGPALGTQGNLNNDIGVPLTLFRLGAEHRYAVLEMGANHSGEIAALCALARPMVGIVTQCAPAHLEGFGSEDGVARAKGELYAGLAPNATAVINADDRYAPVWRALAAHSRQLSFGLAGNADVGAEVDAAVDVSQGSHFMLRTPAGSVRVGLALPGRHNVMNALAAAAAALALGVPLETISAGLQTVRPIQGRMQPQEGPHGARVFDDSYNANPGSLKAALEVLAACSGERWLVLGDMNELGTDTEHYHREAGRLARSLGIDRLYATGALAQLSAEAFGHDARHYADASALAAHLGATLGPGVTVLIKGSRGMHMERVLAQLQAVA